MSFPEALAGVKHFEIIFAVLNYFKQEIFVFCGVFFSRYVQIKSSFSDKNTPVVKSETHFSRG